MSNDPTDPTDFLGTALAALSPLDAALRCQVCKDLFNTPMLTACAHSFCSLCIRRCYAADGRCPTCRATGQDAHLRKNAALGEAVEAWRSARACVLEVGKGAGGAERGIKRKLEGEAVGRRTRSKAKRVVEDDENHEVTEVADSESEEDDGDGGSGDDGLVACPMCSQRMKEAAVFSHLDHCDGQVKRTPSRHNHSSSSISSPTPLNPLTRAARTRAATTKPPPTRLPQLNYSLLKDSALRKKLQELGIPTWGSRQLLTRRHTEWVALWNANCDERQPRSKRELLSELDTWERSQGGGSGSGSGSGSGQGTKEFDKQGWARSNRSQFDELIAQARRGRVKAVAAKDEASPAAGVSAKGEGGKEKRDGSKDIEMDSTAPTTIPTEEDDTAATTAPYAANAPALAAVKAKLAAADPGAVAPPPSVATHASSISSSASQPLHAAAAAAAAATVAAPGPRTGPGGESMASLASPPLGTHAPDRELATRQTNMFRLPAEPVSDIEEDGGGGA